MNKDLQEIIDIVEKMQWQYDNDIANINDKKYHLVDKDLLKYIRYLEQENQALKDQIETMQINWKPAPIKNSETIVKTCKCGEKHYLTNYYNEVYDKQKELISDQEICIKNTLQSLNEWKEYAERLEELIDKIKTTTPLELAIMFHDTYEELAPKFNYETRKDTKEFDENSNNGKLMIAVCSKLLDLIKELIKC